MRTVTSTRRLRLGVLALVAALGAVTFVAFGYASSQTPAQAQYAPTNKKAPTISNKQAQAGKELTADPGEWTADPAIQFYSFQWLRCDDKGNACVAIGGATAQKYTPVAADVDHTLRVSVTATNGSGTSAPETSDKTNKVKAAAAPPAPPKGSTIPVKDVSLPNRLVATEVRFSPNPIRSRNSPLGVRVRVLDTRGYVISGALVFVRSTPLVTTSPSEVATGNDGWATVILTPRSNYDILSRQDNLQIFVRVRKPGGDLLAGVSTRRLVQVRIASGF